MAFAPTDPPSPTWRLTAWLTASPEAVPADVLAVLRGRLVVGTLPLVVAALIGTSLASLAVLRVPTPAMLAWFCADLGLTAARLATMLLMQRGLRPGRRRGAWTRLTDAYVLSSLLWCTQIGCGVGLCMAAADAVLTPFACLITTGLVGGLAARNPGAPRMTLVQMLGVVAPFTAGAACSGQPWFWPICAMAPLYLVAVGTVNRRLHADYVAMLSAKRALKHQALHCGLTGLPNRTCFGEALAAALGEPGRGALAPAVLCLDLDGFKDVNDTHGHAAGDVLLRRVADRLRRTIADADTLARLGGDEFAVLLTGERAAAAEAVAAAIVAAVGQPFELGRATRVRVGVSVGIAAASPGDPDGQTLLVRADRALYAAKRQGRGTYRRAPAESPDAPRAANVVAMGGHAGPGAGRDQRQNGRTSISAS
ncbi:hypothetical protein OPKNFCMD_3965 [Methylobacterium crusticola]|uniref:GGDEF domain-containing protein n=1 Tax=Methylobacterium crusticola TaxID=1697972 RepID=A0ABQ4R0X7_9HYPH|nr:GGDEF domain-containing protein [Methylobacterium crusticola]GJD51213.1 hypothetical protein OPKNFCMD_3965 [Methylobacterium crusticola]